VNRILVRHGLVVQRKRKRPRDSYLRWERPGPIFQRLLVVGPGPQLAERGGDVVGVERVPQAEGVGEHADADREGRMVPTEGVVRGCHKPAQDAKADRVEQDDKPVMPASEVQSWGLRERRN
jgi:hypothetical protein